jgi:HD superfamily phosphodiesterase
MHTETAKGIASDRHKRMESYLEDFFSEWELRDINV